MKRDKRFIPNSINTHTFELSMPIGSLKVYDHLMEADLNHVSKKKYCTNVHKLEKQIMALFRIIKSNFTKLEEEKMKSNNIEEILFEWKEAARRFEHIFFAISLITIISAPLILFGRFFFREFTIKKDGDFKCGCDF